ncbi:MAG: hypothetical protein ACOYM5_01415 [Caulobacter sp.]
MKPRRPFAWLPSTDAASPDPPDLSNLRRESKTLTLDMKLAPLIALCAILPTTALAQSAAAGAAPGEGGYAAPVETIEIAGAKGGLMEVGAAAGGYALFARTTVVTSRFIKTKSRIQISYRFVGAASSPLYSGACNLKSEGVSLFGVQWDQRTSELYACETRDQPAGQYALEMALPALSQYGLSGGMVSLSLGNDIDTPEAKAILKGGMRYGTITYDAVPTGFGKAGLLGRRVVLGYVIQRDGHPVGRIDFQPRSENRGVITAPVADADGRAAVLFMALQLLAMPDLYAPAVRASLLGSY